MWSDFVNAYLVNWTSSNTGQTAQNVCEHGSLVSNTDGTVWASTPDFTLSNYAATIEREDGSGTQVVEVNEFTSLLDAFNNQGHTAKIGGVRINKEKYFVVSFDGDRGVMYLRKLGGGACVARSNTAFVIGTFMSSNKMIGLNREQQPQNPGMVNQACEALQEFLLGNNL